MIRIVCISDTHDKHDELIMPAGDVLVHAGDFSFRGRQEEVESFSRWWDAQDYKHKFFIAGNHELSFEKTPELVKEWMSEETLASYLFDNGAEIEKNGVKLSIYGTPWQPWFHDWAFNLRTEQELEQKFEQIPKSTDLIIAHGPPKGFLDMCSDGREVGSNALLQRIIKVRPKLVVTGHIHESYGVKDFNGVTIANASNNNLYYYLTNPPLVFDWDGVSMEQITT